MSEPAQQRIGENIKTKKNHAHAIHKKHGLPPLHPDGSANPGKNGITPLNIVLGEVSLANELSPEQETKLRTASRKLSPSNCSTTSAAI